MLKVTIKVTIKFIIVTEKNVKKPNSNDVTNNALLSNLNINKNFSKVTKFLDL